MMSFSFSLTFLLLLPGFPVMERQQVSFVLSSFHLRVCLHHQAHLENEGHVRKWKVMQKKANKPSEEPSLILKNTQCGLKS